MENEEFGVRGNKYEGIFFSEENIPNSVFIQHIEVEISKQNSNLLEIKNKMIEKVDQLKGNAISCFKYGQKKHKTLELIFSFKWDTESWYGEGDVVKVNNSRNIKNEIKT